MTPRLQGPFASPEAFCETLFDFLTHAGQTRYDETVTQLEHALQTAALAKPHGNIAVVAALLHDICHLLLDEHDTQTDFLNQDLRHEIVGARFLNRWFGPDVATPVALHVKVKRYLVAADAEYAAALSDASTRSLGIQGGPMNATEVERFRTLPHAELAILLRRWDDRAKQADALVPGLSHWREAVIAVRRAAV
jgi:phosphonate degradation associated HDIG domain protein